MQLKRVVSAALAVSMAVSMVPATAVTAFADGVSSETSITAENEVAVTIDGFTKGSLSDAIADTYKGEVANITSLTVKGGELNADDFYYIRDSLTGLVALDLSGATCENNTIPNSALYKGNKAENHTLKYFAFPKGVVKIEDDAFNRCEALTNFGYGEGILQLPETVAQVGDRSFAFLFGFTSINLPRNLEKAGTWSFAYCNNLKGTIVIPGTLSEIPKAMFESTENADNYVNTVVISEGIESIDNFAFRNRSTLKNINFPSTLKEIGAEVFTACTALEDVELNDGLETIGNVAFGSSGVKYVKLPATLKTYKNAFGGMVDFTACQNVEVNQSGLDVIYILSNASNIVWSADLSAATKAAFTTLYTNGGYVKEYDYDNRSVTPAKKGYVFSGWYENAESTEPKANTLEKGKTYYAKWEKLPDHELTVKGGTFTFDENAATDKGSVYEGALVTVTFDEDNALWKDSGLRFDHWDIQSKEKLVDEKGNEIINPGKTFTFVMPKEGVTIEAMAKDATIDDDSSEALGIAAAAVTGVVGTAVLAYQGYMLGSELYLTYLLPAGAAIPANRAELALLVWNDAGKPAPAAVLNADAADTDKAILWAVENQLMAAADKSGEALTPDASVSRMDVIKTWKKAQELKNN